MIINHEKKFIFVHVFRTGGTSIDRAFGKWALPPNETHKRLETIPNWQDYFSFGFVRNPWDRTLSGHMYQTKKGNTTDSFEKVVLALEPGKKSLAQYNMIQNCSYVGRFEHLREDLQEICNIIGIPVPTLPHLWRTDHEHYKEYYTDEMIESVREHQQGDIKHFGFSFESAATRNVGDRRC